MRNKERYYDHPRCRNGTMHWIYSESKQPQARKGWKEAKFGRRKAKPGFEGKERGYVFWRVRPRESKLLRKHNNTKVPTDTPVRICIDTPWNAMKDLQRRGLTSPGESVFWTRRPYKTKQKFPQTTPSEDMSGMTPREIP